MRRLDPAERLSLDLKMTAFLPPQQSRRREGEYQTAFTSPAGLPPIDPEEVQRHGADAYRVWSGASGKEAARCSLWWRRGLSLGNQRLGIIGHYAATGAHAGA